MYVCVIVQVCVCAYVCVSFFKSINNIFTPILCKYVNLHISDILRFI